MKDTVIHRRYGSVPFLIGLLTVSLLNPPRAGAQEGAEQEEVAPTTWTNAQGSALEADFVRLTEDSVILKLKRDGREVAVPLASLSIESHFQAVKAGNPAAFSKPVPKAEVKEEIVFELPQLNLNVDELLKSPFPANTKIEQFFDILKREYAAGNYFVQWHTAPAKMQADTEEVIVRTIELIGPETIRQLQILLNDLNTVARDKQKFIFEYPMLAAQPMIVEILEQQWPLIAGLLEAIAREEHWRPQNFQKGNVPRWLANLTVAVAPYVMALQDSVKSSMPPGVELGDPASMQYNIVSQSADTAEVEVSIGNAPPQKASYQKVGNIWIVPKEMNEARKSLDAANENLAKGAVTEMGLVRSTLAGAIAAVGGLARANSQEEFNQAADLLAGIVRGLAQTAKAAGFASPAGPPTQPAGRSRS